MSHHTKDEASVWWARFETAFRARGAAVRRDEGAGNLLRARRSDDAVPRECEWIVEVQTLENLVHEFVHAVHQDRLSDDHGFDYDRIPLDLERRADRETTWEELACCLLSAAIVEAVQGRERASAWFAEQVDIWPVFHGATDEREVVQRVEAALVAHPDEARDALARARARTELALRTPLPEAEIEAFWPGYAQSRLDRSA